jgi:hypothetical protein
LKLSQTPKSAQFIAEQLESTGREGKKITVRFSIDRVHEQSTAHPENRYATRFFFTLARELVSLT